MSELKLKVGDRLKLVDRDYLLRPSGTTTCVVTQVRNYGCVRVLWDGEPEPDSYSYHFSRFEYAGGPW